MGDATKKPWRRVLGLVLWLHLMFPVGIWKLWHDPVLSASAKWRIFCFLFLLPWLAYLTISVTSVSRGLQGALP